MLRASLAVVLGAFLALFFACSVSGVSHYVSREPVLRHVRESVPLMNTFRRSDTFTECLVMGAAALDSQGMMSDIFDFKRLDTTIPKDPSVSHDKAPCASLRAFAAGEDPNKIGISSYTRYWSGPVSLARFVLFAMPFLPAYILYALSCIAALALWGWALAKRGISPKKAALISFACFYGGSFFFFIGNLSHTPAYALPILFIALITIKSAWWESMEKSLFLAAFIGGVTFYLDMLFLAIPFNAILLGVTWLLLNPQAKGSKLLLLLAAYGFAGAVLLGLKVLVVGYLSNEDVVFQDFFKQLLWRMSSEDGDGVRFTLWELFLRIPVPTAKMFAHPLVLALLYVLGIYGLVKGARVQAPRAFAFIVLAAIVPVWCFLFSNHSWIHGSFTARILFWPPLLGALAWLDVSPGKNLFLIPSLKTISLRKKDKAL